MATLPQNAPSRRVYNALLDAEHGYLLMDPQGTIFFRNSATDALTLVTPANLEAITKLGEVALSETQALRDSWRGGAARIATTRLQEVA